MMATVRLRILFKDKHLLTESMAKEGMNRTWILLKPHISSISDLSSYILAAFRLHDACPDGLILCMDGFVLPPFESVCILKDKDIVRVRKKRSKAIDIHKVTNRTNLIETEEFKERQPLDNGVNLLADKEFENESVGHESESDKEEPEDTPPVETARVIKKSSKKRKASKIIHNSKRKKNKSSPAEEVPTIIADAQHTDTEHGKSNHLKRELPQKVLVSGNNSSSTSSESDTSKTDEVDGRSIVSKSANGAERAVQLGVGKRNLELSSAAAESKKGPSRSSRRKKAKRRWLREKTQNKEQQPMSLGTSIHQGPSQDDADMDDDTVPVVIRPGHIRFEPIGKVAANQAGQQNHCPQETLNWNGITNKKKGQKWGKEKTPSWKKNNYNTSTGEQLKVHTPEAGQPKTPAPVVGPIEFDKLRPCASLPQEGDLVAYRLIELSSTWTPEISSFRVGKVAWYDTDSNRIMLIPVPEYPFVFKKEIDDDSAGQLDKSPYGEDGSLKIDFASLIDLRLIKEENIDSSKAAICNGSTSAGQTPESSFKVTNNIRGTDNTGQDNRKVNAWDEISQALSAKKAQLSQNDGWNQEENSGRSSWSYRALRGSALGPTMALLRAQNEL